MSTELTVSARYELAEQQTSQAIESQSEELSLWRELKVLRFQLSEEVKADPASRRVTALTDAIRKTAESESRLSLLQGHTILLSALQDMKSELEAAITSIIKKELVDEFGDEVAERVGQKIFLALGKGALVTEARAAQLNREQGVR